MASQLQHLLLQFILLASSLLLSHGLGGRALETSLKNGSQYYIQLDVKTLCSNSLNYIGYPNLTCISEFSRKEEARFSGPILVTGPSSQKNSALRRWTVNIKKKLADGTYLAVLSNKLPLNSKSSEPRCLGSISIAKPGLCKSGKFVDSVFIEKDGEQVWRIIPLSGSSDMFMIVSKNRDPGCLRYLGASKDCTASSLKVYLEFDGSGLQRWKFIPLETKQQQQDPSVPAVPLQSPPALKKSPPPPVIPHSPPPTPVLLLPPGKPTKVNALPTATSSVAILTWEDGAAAPGTAAETYQVKCVAAFSGCDGLSRGNSQSGIPRGTQRGTVTGLAYRNELRYTCFVVASNTVGSVCSDDPVTLEIPDAPTGIISTFPSQYTWLATWDVGASGYPEEIYSLQCFQRGAGCSGTPLSVSSNIIERWKRQGSVTLPAGAAIDCYVVAENSAGRACSAPVAITTSW